VSVSLSVLSFCFDLFLPWSLSGRGLSSVRVQPRELVGPGSASGGWKVKGRAPPGRVASAPLLHLDLPACVQCRGPSLAINKQLALSRSQTKISVPWGRVTGNTSKPDASFNVAVAEWIPLLLRRRSRVRISAAMKRGRGKQPPATTHLAGAPPFLARVVPWLPACLPVALCCHAKGRALLVVSGELPLFVSVKAS